MGIQRTLLDILIVLAAPVLLLGGYYFFWKSSDELESARPGAEIEAQGAKVREALGIVRGIQFNGAVFASPAFTSLVDQTVPIIDEPIGRDQPLVYPEVIKRMHANPIKGVRVAPDKVIID